MEQTLWARGRPEGAIHQSDRGNQYVSIGYSEWLSEAGFTASFGSTGDSYSCGNALAETINGLYKAEMIYKDGPWRRFELATLDWDDWFNNRRLLSSIGDIPPAE